MRVLILAAALIVGPFAASAPYAFGQTPMEAGNQADVQAITQLLNDQYAAWNRQDIDGFMIPLWQSPSLVYVSEGQFCLGWQEAKAMIERSYADRSSMGTAVPERIQINFVSSDYATSIDWWIVRFKTTSVRGISTDAWRKFTEGWRIVETHATVSDFPNMP
jgi:hypothetical protein